jgi:hypothetical protein
MIHAEIMDDGFRVTEIGSYRWRVHPLHEAASVRAIRRRWKRESALSGENTNE